MKTTSANISDMKQQIRLDTLQETIVDAIRLTQELGIQYLWVDALCILQDSKQDWETESAKMGSIYANAVITFASVSSRSAAVPFLRHENSKEAAEQQQQVFSQMVETETGPMVIKARLIEQSGIHWRWRSDSDQRAPKEPWAQRGWTLQEQVLSSRLLMISSTEMQWVCRQAETCECLSTLNRRRQFGGTPLAQLTDAGETFRFWHKLVETYSNRTLTHGHDKLPAISGIAEVLQQKTASRYVAGLWESNFDLDLLWHKAGSWDNAQGSDPQAPSFSWASVDGEVDYYCFRNGRQKYKRSTTVLHIDLKTRPQAPLGTVDGAMLTLRGPLAEARITKYSGNTWAMVSIADHVLEFIPDTHLGYVAMRLAAGPEPVACRRRDGQLGIEPMQPQGSDTDTVIEFSPGIRCWIVKLGEFEFPGGEDEQVGAELMVMGVPASQHGCLERLGLISDVTGEVNSFFRKMENSNFLLM
ncbi:hypothetical protein PWT90_06137 [Aphanocladium album]|nr:hypothetical protein PWT90_06137 [Aphanocladium album]